MPAPLELVVMTGGNVSTPEERMMADAWRAATLDWVEKAQQVAEIERILVAVNAPDFAAELRAFAPHVLTSLDTPPFHFGRRLRDIVAAHGLRKPFYAGAGSGILFPLQDMQSLAQTVYQGENLLIANNFYSSDFVAFTPGDAIRRIEPPDTDNDLAWRLGRQADLETLSLPPSAGSLFDLDTPVDLMIAAFHPDTPNHLRAYLAGLDLDCGPIRRALNALRAPEASVVIAGRVGASARSQLEERLGCKVSSFAEERACGPAAALLGAKCAPFSATSSKSRAPSGSSRSWPGVPTLSSWTAACSSHTSGRGLPTQTATAPTCSNTNTSPTRC